MSLESILSLEGELAAVEHLSWGSDKQGDERDSKTKFIYHCSSLAQVRNICGQNELDEALTAYAFMRFYNLRAHDSLLELFHLADPSKVQLEQDKCHKTIDFYIDRNPFDLKLSLLPRYYVGEGNFCPDLPQEHKHIVHYLYRNQSRESRHHECNKLFALVANLINPKDSWKLKREFRRFYQLINFYLENFTQETLVPYDDVVSDSFYLLKGHNEFIGVISDDKPGINTCQIEACPVMPFYKNHIHL